MRVLLVSFSVEMPVGKDGGHGAERCMDGKKKKDAREKKRRMFSQYQSRSKLSEMLFLEVCVLLDFCRCSRHSERRLSLHQHEAAEGQASVDGVALRF